MNESDKFTLTRYLYSKKEVEQSMILSLLEHTSDEALFWAYELYYSGFDTYVFKFVLKTFNLFYKKENTQLESFIVETIEEWNQDNSKDYLLGSIVYTLSTRDYHIDEFINIYNSGDDKTCVLVPPKNEAKKRKFIIKMTMKDIDIYTPLNNSIHTADELSTKLLVTDLNIAPKRGADSNLHWYKKIESQTMKNWKILSGACRYPIRTNVNHIFGTEKPENIEDVYNTDHWLYYACRSPVWKERVLLFEGKMDDETQEIVFPNDDLFDDFYDCWGYEPDEQPTEVKEILMGASNEKQTTVEEFCGLYGGVLTRNSNEDLTNSMIYK